MKLRLHSPDGKVSEAEIAKSTARLGRDPTCDVVFDAREFPRVSGLHAELVVKDSTVWLVHRSKSNSTVIRDTAISKPVRLQSGDRFRLGYTGPEVEYLGMATSQATVAPSTQSDATLFAGKAADMIGPVGNKSQRFQVPQQGTIGRLKECEISLEHPHVSRRHAYIKLVQGQVQIGDAGSSNGTFVNGRRLQTPVAIRPGDVIDIGPYSLVLEGDFLVTRSRANNVRIDLANVSCVVTEATSKRALHLLHDVSFRIEPGEFVSVIGPSGSGKSTLLGIASGRRWPFSGHVYLNGRDLHKNFGALKEDLVVVPQTSALHETLSVRRTIHYATQLRLPPDTRADELESSTRNIMAQVGIEHRAETRVGQLSGGQLKRLGLACELISDPSLLFLDEVTSGLDEQSDGEMMSLFRQLADSGKTIVCITHNLAHVEEYCHKVLVLTAGGRLAFIGTPQLACQYFQVGKLADIYTILGTRRAEQWSAAFLSYQQSQQVQPNTVGMETDQAERTSTKNTVVERLGLKPLRQCRVLTWRYLDIWRGDTIALLAMLGQAILVTTLLCLVFRAIPASGDQQLAFARATEIRNLLFLTGISCLWLGANNSAKEVVKERRIYQRERDFNLSPEAFWISKVLVLGSLGVVQSLFLTLPTGIYCDLPIGLVEYCGIGILLSFIGTNLGLAISANSRTEEFSVALVPVVVIPQIILAGVVAELSGVSLWLAKILTVSFWSQKLLELHIPDTDRVVSEYEPTWPVCSSVLAAHGLVYLFVSWFGIRYKNA